MDYYMLILLVLVCLNSSYAQQYYDKSDCTSNQSYPGSRYTCNHTFQDSCKTFLVYRATQRFDTVSRISNLLNVPSDALLRANNLSSPSKELERGREVLVPIDCSCSGRFFRANWSYTAPETTSLSEIACGVFEGLVKLFALAEENPSRAKIVEAGSTLRLPFRCACPDNFTRFKGIKYLATYPFVEGDDTVLVSKKFGISAEDLWEVNHLDTNPTVYPFTTVLVPLRAEPEINLKVPGSSPPSPGFLPTLSVEKHPMKSNKPRDISIAGSIIVLVAGIACFLHVKVLKQWNGKKYRRFAESSSPILTARSSVCLSPDLLVGIKFSLFNYTAGEIRKATGDFSDENKMEGFQVYKGVIDGVIVMVKQMRFEDTRWVIDAHSKINHINIIKLVGVCYGDNHELSWSYLVFEYPINGCLRDFLSDSSSSLQWPRRVKIAFDIATGLHYLHCCIFPSYAHTNIHSRNIFVASDFRAKLGEIGAKPVGESASEKADIYAFGAVLLELVSGRENNDGRSLKEYYSVGFSGCEGGCFEKLRSFVDPRLGDDYSLPEAFSLAVLGKACLEEDSLNRPSMDDIFKVLSRMVGSG